MQWKNIPICNIHGLLDIKHCIPSLDQRFLATRTNRTKDKQTETKPQSGQKAARGAEVQQADDPRTNGGLVLGALAGHLHGLRSVLVVRDQAAGGALHLWTGMCAAARAVCRAHAGGRVSARSSQSGHTGSGHWERREKSNGGENMYAITLLLLFWLRHDCWDDPEWGAWTSQDNQFCTLSIRNQPYEDPRGRIMSLHKNWVTPAHLHTAQLMLDWLRYDDNLVYG